MRHFSLLLFLLVPLFLRAQDTSKVLGKVAFIVGFGANYALDDIYLPPSVDEVTKFVRIEKDKRYRGNFSFGISYTFSKFKYSETILIKDDHYDTQRTPFIKGFTFSLFINPALLANVGTQGVNAPSDLGFGLGYRNGAFSIFGTMELFRLNQPREYFIEAYRDKDAQYAIDGETQTMIAQDNANIFAMKTYLAFGIKACYTLDVIKLASTSTNTTR